MTMTTRAFFLCCCTTWAGVAAVFFGVAAVAPAAIPEGEMELPPGIIVEEDDLPLDDTGEPALDVVPGVGAPKGLSAAVERRLHELAEQRADMSDTAFSDIRPADAVPPATEGGPPRLDSGARDPDRPRPAPPVPLTR